MINNLLEKKIISHNNLNGLISTKINKVGKSKIFNKANIFIKFDNGRVSFKNTELYLKDYASLKFLKSELIEENGLSFLKAKLVLVINNDKKFYQRFQILKKNRIPVKKIYFDIEKNLVSNEFRIVNIEIFSKSKKYTNENFTDLLTLYNEENNNNEISGLIKLNYFFNKIFETIS